MSEKQIYRLIAGKQTGPYPPGKLRPLVVDGRISRLDRFSYDAVEWLPADCFPELMLKEGSNVFISHTLPERRLGLEGSGTPPPLSSELVATVPRLKHRTRRIRWLWVARGSCAAVLMAAGLSWSWATRAFEHPIDVTDEFALLADSIEGYEGKKVVVRGVYFPSKLISTSQGPESAITFRSTSGCLLNGDCAYRLTLLASEHMTHTLRKVAERLANEQPATITFLCKERRSGDRHRTYGLVDNITFYKHLPEENAEEELLRVDNNGNVQEQ